MRRFLLAILILLVASDCAFSQNFDKIIDSLNRTLNTEKEDTNRVNVLNELSFDYQQSGNVQSSLSAANNGMALATKLNYKKGIGQAYNNLGVVHWNRNNYPEALKDHFEALKIGQEIGNNNIIARSYTGVGNIYLNEGDFSGAMKNFQQELAIRESTNSKYEEAFSYSRIANVYILEGNYPEALKNYISSIKMAEEAHNKISLCGTYGNMGIVYERQGNYAEALKNYFASLTIAREINRVQAIANDYDNIGSVYSKEGNYTEALKYKLEGLKIGESISDKNFIAAMYQDIGIDYLKLNNYSDALKNELSALKIADEIGDKSNIASASCSLGEIYLHLGKYDKAREYLDHALVVSKALGSRELIKESYGQLSALDSVTGNYKGAYENLRLFAEIKDSLTNLESSKQISQLRIQYDTEKKDQQIEKQALQNKILQSQIYYGMAIALLIIGVVVLLFNLRNRRKKKEYEHALVSLELTLLKSQLNPHFISNSLSAIKAFIDKQPERASQFLSKFARLIRLVLEQSEQPLITLEEELKTVELYMQIESLRLDHGFDYRFEIDPSVDKTELMVPPLILQPTIENAIWHGLAPKNSKGHIIIYIKLESGLLRFRIEDNGTGQKPEPLSENVNPHERKSFGLSITRKRIELLNKELNKEGYFSLNFLTGYTVAEIALPVNLH